MEDEYEAEEVHDFLAERVVDLFNSAKRYRNSKHVMNKPVSEWFDLLYNAYNKVHEPCEIADLPDMVSYFGLVQIKTNMTASMMRDMLANSIDAPFDIEPTEEPELPKSKKELGRKQVELQLLQRLIDNGLPVEAIRDDKAMGSIRPEIAKVITALSKESKELIKQEEIKIASEACLKMKRLITDQLTDADFGIGFSEALHDINLMPCMVVSYETTTEAVAKWRGNKYERVEEVVHKLRRINPKNAYFAPNAKTAQDGSFFIELAQRTESELSGLAKADGAGYIQEAIECVLENDNTNWLGLMSDEDGELDIDDDSTDLIDVLRCQMQVSAEDLEQYDFEVDDDGVKKSKKHSDLDYYDVDIEVVGGRVIKCKIMPYPIGRRTYFSCSYKSSPDCPWGISPAMMVYDRQLRVNRIQYGMGLNAAVSSAPMMEMRASHFSNPEHVRFRPMQTVLANPEMDERLGSGIYMHQVQPMFQLFFGQLQNEIRLADDECGIPAFLNGNGGLQGGGATLGGMALMRESAIMGINDCIYNIDNYFIEPFIELMYSINMQYSKDDTIKADAKIKATGVLGLKKEMEKQRALAGMLPTLRNYTQANVIPAGIEQDALRQWGESAGLNMSSYMPNSGSKIELESAVASRPVTAPPALDGRSGAALNAMQ